MDLYAVALYGHFLALVTAVVVSSILHFNYVRLRRATTLRDARQSLGVIASTAKIFPAAALALFLTGAWLTSLRWGWHWGWVYAGIAGLASLSVVGGAILKPRIDALGRLLDAAQGDAISDDVAAAIANPVIAGGLNGNHAIALLVMLVMVLKPSGAVAAAILLLGPAFGVLSALATRIEPVKALGTEDAT